jgi:uncharacterized membrane protein
MPAPDPWGAALLLGLAAAPLAGAAVRRGRRALGAALGAAFGAGAAWGAAALEPSAPTPALAALAGAVAALWLPGLPLGVLRRRSFGSAYPRGTFAGSAADARLPAALAGARPSRLLDAADRLRLESAFADAERKHGVVIAAALVARAGETEGAHARAALYGAALALAAGAAAGVTALAGFGAGALGAVAGRTLARSAHVRRIFVSEDALAAAAAQAASDAFAHAGLDAAPRQRGLLVFAALFEARVVVLAAPGLAGAGGSQRMLEAVAEAAARGLAAGRATEGFLGAAAAVELLAARETAGSAAPRPHPVRVED